MRNLKKRNLLFFLHRALLHVLIVVLIGDLIFSHPSLPSLGLILGQKAEAYDCTKEPVLCQQKKECENQPSKQWSYEMNRCVETPNATANKGAYTECEKLTKAEDKKACHDKLALDSIQKDHNFDAKRSTADDEKNFLEDASWCAGGDGKNCIAAGLAVYLALNGTLLVLNKMNYRTQCPSASLWIMLGGAVVAIAGELFVNLYYFPKNLEKIEDRFKDTGGDARTLQKKAFEILIEVQKLMQKTLKAKLVIYALTSATFFAAALWGLKEYGQYTACTKPNVANNGASTSFLIKAIIHPAGRFLVAGLIGGLSAALADHSRQRMNDTDDRIAAIEKTRDALFESLEGYKNCESRDDLSQPDCYCYNEDGTKDMTKRKSETCTKHWTRNEVKLNIPTATNYNIKKKETISKGCVTRNGEFDRLCECKKVTDEKGNNNCHHGRLTGASMGAGANTLLQRLEGATNAISNGERSFNNLNTQKTQNLASQLKTAFKKNHKKLEENLAKQGLPPTGIQDKSFEEAFRQVHAGLSPEDKKFIDDHTLKGAEPQNALASLSSSLNPEEKKALESALESTGLKSSLSFGSAAKSLGEENKNMAPFSLGGSSSHQSRSGVEEFPETMNLKIKDNDIHKNGNTSLWDIISGRYQKSAFERLFRQQEN